LTWLRAVQSADEGREAGEEVILDDCDNSGVVVATYVDATGKGRLSVYLATKEAPDQVAPVVTIGGQSIRVHLHQSQVRNTLCTTVRPLIIFN
jgi:hypothetical protein